MRRSELIPLDKDVLLIHTAEQRQEGMGVSPLPLHGDVEGLPFLLGGEREVQSSWPSVHQLSWRIDNPDEIPLALIVIA